MPDVSLLTGNLAANSAASGLAGRSQTDPSASFGSMVQEYLGDVSQAQNRADELVEALALGEPVDVHQVMMALNEASNAVNLTLQLRNKGLEAYQEVMRLQI